MTVDLRAWIIALACLGMAPTGARAAAPSGAAGPARVVLPGDREYPESVTSSADGTLYVGSLGEGGVRRARPGATHAERWIAAGASGSRSMLGVLADEPSGTLWACSNDLSSYGVHVPGSDAAPVLKGFDLRTGAPTRSVPLPGAHALCNDIAVGPDGAAYVSDSGTGVVLRLAPGGREFDAWASDARFAAADGASVDGIAVGEDGAVYVSTYTRGELYRIVATGGTAPTITRLALSRPLEHPDGMRRIRGTVFALVESGGRVDVVAVTDDRAVVTTVRDGLAGPTALTIVGSTAWVAEGQLDSLFAPPGKRAPPRLPFSVTAVPLPAADLHR